MTAIKDRAYRVVSVPFGKDFIAFSRLLEDKMNELVENGYTVQLMPTPRGVVVLGQHKASTRDSLYEALTAFVAAAEGAEKATEDTAIELPARLKVLLDVIEETAGSGNIVEMTKALPRILPSLLKGAPSEAIFDAAKDCDDTMHRHNQTHKQPGTCIFSTFLKTLAEQLRGFVKLQMQ